MVTKIVAADMGVIIGVSVVVSVDGTMVEVGAEDSAHS